MRVPNKVSHKISFSDSDKYKLSLSATDGKLPRVLYDFSDEQLKKFQSESQMADMSDKTEDSTHVNEQIDDDESMEDFSFQNSHNTRI